MTFVQSLNARMEPVVTEDCAEPEGMIRRSIYPMLLSADNLKAFWDKAKGFRTIFDQEVAHDFRKFAELFISQEGDQLRAHGLFWVLDDFVGVYYMTHISTIDALVHYTFFDRRHIGRENITKKLIAYVFQKYGFWRLNVEIPLYASQHTFGFVRALGFRKEGRKRKAAEYKGDRFDVSCFGLLREEALNGDQV